jgi:5-methylcytosine-specific restriction protein A
MPRAPKKCGKEGCEERTPGGVRYCAPHTLPWEGSTRALRLPPNWPTLRKTVSARAGGQCEWATEGSRCPRPGSECDHIRRGDDHSPANLQWLCKPHHASKTSEEGNRAQWGT